MSLEHLEKIPLNKITHSVRAAQAVLQYGVGAMVDFPDQTLMTAAPETWKERVVQIHDERLQKVLNVDYFGMPSGDRDGITYARFPEWYFCPKCRRFQPLSKWISDARKKGMTKRYKINKEEDKHLVSHLFCPHETGKWPLVVTRIVTICEHGHIDDFPWVKWTHCRNRTGAKNVCEYPELRFKTAATSSEGLEGLTVECVNCKASATLKGAFGKNVLFELDKKHDYRYDFSCTGRHPWKNTRESCQCYPQVTQRGSSSVYFPVTLSSLVIPPYSSKLTEKVVNTNAYRNLREALARDKKVISSIPGFTPEMIAMMAATTIDAAKKDIVNATGLPAHQVNSILQRILEPSDAEEYTTESLKYRAEEYEALNGSFVIEEDDDDFVRESMDMQRYNMPYLKSISLIHKIREIQVLTGFTRSKPVDKSTVFEAEESATIVSVKEKDTNWYPGYEVRGEGIFIEFDSDAIDRWRNDNDTLRRRVEILNANYKKSFLGQNNPKEISAKYLFLHTMAHLLIKQLSFECGYSIASIKERIYCSEASEGKDMSGILIYTANGDSEGTMGGLVRQGRPDTLPLIFKKAIQEAVTCSNDPVCSLSLGQGRDSLNLSACYSCSLLPETSCEQYNTFLDRGVIIGTFEDRELGFFSHEVYSLPESEEHRTETGEPSVSNEVPRVSLIIRGGTDMADTPYPVIWNELAQWSESNNEHQLFEDCKACANFTEKEKPLLDCEFSIVGKDDVYVANLLWLKSKVALFTEENISDYEIAKSSDWTCIVASDASVDVGSILEKLKER